MKLFVIFIFITVFTELSIAQTKFVDEESYRKIELGITLEETEKIFGVKGTLDTTLIYVWPDNNLQVEWVDQKINSYSTTSTLLKDNEINGYEKLKEACAGPDGPMTYNQTYKDVVKLIGKEGQKPDWKRYLWWVNKYKKIKIVFENKKVKSKEMF
jgi:hypothetical protein